MRRSAAAAARTRHAAIETGGGAETRERPDRGQDLRAQVRRGLGGGDAGGERRGRGAALGEELFAALAALGQVALELRARPLRGTLRARAGRPALRAARYETRFPLPQYGRSRSRSFIRPRRARVLTVPSGVAVRSAISCWVRPSK